MKELTLPPAISVGTAGTLGTGYSLRVSSGSTTKKGSGTRGTLAPINPLEQTPADPPAAHINRPEWRTHDDWFLLNGSSQKPGLYWHGFTSPRGDADPEPVDSWICSPIHAEAMTQDERGTSHGLLLRFCDPSGRWKEWAAPLHLLKGSGEELRGELLDNGVRLSLKAPRLLLEWMMGQYPKARVTAATNTGWSRDGSAFVLPGRTIGKADIRFQSEYATHDAYTQRGTLAGWRETVAKPCQHNPVLVLATSVAFAGPLLLKAKQQQTGGAGIHLMGDSSKGKTTALQVAASVWGAPEFVASWRATGNGMEASAAARNDTLLPLDEISESNPKEIGSIIYALANGHGKQRAARTGGARQSARWRVMALSSGERSLAAHMHESGKRTKAGQEARLLDISATSRKYGSFDNLHGLANGAAFSNSLKKATSDHYGLAGPAFIERLLADSDDLSALYADTCSLADLAGSDGVESRAAGTFALIAMAGEKAIEYGLTGWPEGEALKACIDAFHQWRNFRGRGSTETRQILD